MHHINAVINPVREDGPVQRRAHILFPTALASLASFGAPLTALLF